MQLRKAGQRTHIQNLSILIKLPREVILQPGNNPNSLVSNCAQPSNHFVSLKTIKTASIWRGLSKQKIMIRKNAFGRRYFLGTAAKTMAAGSFVMTGITNGESVGMSPADERKIKKGQQANNSFGPIKQIDARLLNMGYAE